MEKKKLSGPHGQKKKKRKGLRSRSPRIAGRKRQGKKMKKEGGKTPTDVGLLKKLGGSVDFPEYD